MIFKLKNYLMYRPLWTLLGNQFILSLFSAFLCSFFSIVFQNQNRKETEICLKDYIENIFVGLNIIEFKPFIVWFEILSKYWQTFADLSKRLFWRRRIFSSIFWLNVRIYPKNLLWEANKCCPQMKWFKIAFFSQLNIFWNIFSE